MGSDITQQIIDAMITNKITYGEVASELGISRPTIWRKMNRPEIWRLGELQKLSRLLGIDFEILCDA